MNLWTVEYIFIFFPENRDLNETLTTASAINALCVTENFTTSHLNKILND